MKKRQEENRSYAGIIFVACFFFLVGVLISAVELALKPVPDGPFPPGKLTTEVCYTRGVRDARPGWDEKAKKVWHGVAGTYLFDEGELNSLLNKHVDNSVAIEGLESVHVEELPNVRLLPGKEAQVGVVLSFPEYFSGHRFVYQVRGNVVRGGFRPQMGWIGQCPVPFLNMRALEIIRRQLVLDKDITGLPELRERVSFSREGDYLEVSVAAKE
ncbi:MAG TPA: hypothetical protein PKI32_09625 [Opitutales bacterium]|nr:hypothetical protein [Opitutales bacterium]